MSFNNSITREIITLNTNGTYVVPAGMFIEAVCIENTTANAITGGLKIGTTAGGSDVLNAYTVGASLLSIIDDELLKKIFSKSSNTTLYIQAVTAWNSASINLTFCLINSL
jgi:hypothetical protein